MPENKLPTPSPAENEAQDPILATLAQADFSKASGSRSALRGRLLQSAGRTSSSRGLRLALEVGGLAVLALFFLFAVTRLVNNQSPIPAATLPPPSATPTPPPTPPATPTPLPPLQTPAPELSLNSSADTVRLAISQPTWKSLWAQIELDFYSTPGDTSTLKRTFSQSWLEQARRGLVLSTDEITASQSFTLDFGVRYVLQFDPANLTIYDKQTGTTQSAPRDSINQTLHPIVGSAATLDLIYPDFLMILSSEPRLVRMEPMAGRPALVAEWGNSRLWVDTHTGLLLRAERYSGQVGASPLESVLSMLKVEVDPNLDEAVFSPAHLNELAFVQGPALAPTGLTPTPFSQTSPEGWVYFQAAAQAPFEWKVYQLPAGCLAEGGMSCLNPQTLPGNPNLQITGLYWAPDHSLAVFSDNNNNQIVGYDPQARQWPRLLPGFFQPQLIWSPDSTQIAALTEGVDPYDMRLVIISRTGWTVRDVPTHLKGEKQVYGWLDARTLAVKVPDVSFKGTPPAWAATDLHPGIYRIDVQTGESSLLPVNAAKPFALSLSQDGTQFVYYQWINNLASIVVASPDGKQSHLLGVEGNSPAWSPDGKWILFQTYTSPGKNQPTVTTLYIVHPEGSGLRKVASTSGEFESLWNPDSSRLLLYEYGPELAPSKTLTVFEAATGRLTQIVLPESYQVVDLLGWQP